jgi:AcrR family transcriptional regulator
MAKQAVDRRIQRTRALLQDAMVAMIVEKGYEGTTVQDIIDRANVGRATFYAHFGDKESLLVSRIEDLRELLKREQREAAAAAGESRERGFGFSLTMLEHAKGHWRLYKSMVGKRSGTVVLQHIHRMIADLVRDDLVALGYKTAAAQRELVVQHVTGAFMGVLTWWLDHAPSLTPEEVDAIFQRLMMQGLRREIGGQPESARRA